MSYSTARAQIDRAVGPFKRLDRGEIARRISCSRREFLRTAAGVALGAACCSAGAVAAWATTAEKRKVVVITFGGGARDQETFAPEGQENIPHLMSELDSAIHILLSGDQSRHPGPLRGHCELGHRSLRNIQQFCRRFHRNIPPRFEYFRKDLKRPASDAWVVAPSNGFNRIGESNYRSLRHRARGECNSAETFVDRGESGGAPITSIFCATITKRRCTRRNWRAANSNCSNWR